MSGLTNELQDAIDRLVTAAHQGITPGDDDIETLRNDWDDIFGRTDYVTNGLPFGTIQSRLNDDDLADYQGIDIQEITNELRVEYARERLASEASDFDADCCPAFRAGTIRSSTGLDAWVFFSVTGYSFSGIEVSFEGVYPSEDSFRKGTRSMGYLLTDEIGSAEDTIEFVTDRQILDCWEK